MRPGASTPRRPEFQRPARILHPAFRPAPTLDCLAARRHLPLLAALACLVGLVVAGVFAFAVPAAHERDAAMLHGFVGLDRPSVHRAISFLAHLGVTLPDALRRPACIASR